MKKISKKKLNNYKKHNYDHRHKMEAYQVIEKDTNYVLSNKNKSIIDEYAKEVLRSTVYSPWLYVYTAYNQKFIEGWLPDNYFGCCP